MPRALDRLKEIEEEREKQSSALETVQGEKSALGGPPYLLPSAQEMAEALTSEEGRLKREIGRLDEEKRDLLPAAQKEAIEIARLNVLRQDLVDEKAALTEAEKRVNEEKEKLGDRAPNPSEQETAGALAFDVYRIKNNIQVIERDIADAGKRLDQKGERGIEARQTDEAWAEGVDAVTAELAANSEEKALSLGEEAGSPETVLEFNRALGSETQAPPPLEVPGHPTHADPALAAAMLAGLAMGTIPLIKDAVKHYGPKIDEYVANKELPSPEGGRPVNSDGTPVRDPPVTEQEAIVRKGDEKREALDKSIEQIQHKFDERHADTDPDKREQLQTKLDEQFKLLRERLEQSQQKELAHEHEL